MFGKLTLSICNDLKHNNSDSISSVLKILKVHVKGLQFFSPLVFNDPIFESAQCSLCQICV